MINKNDENYVYYLVATNLKKQRKKNLETKENVEKYLHMTDNKDDENTE